MADWYFVYGGLHDIQRTVTRSVINCGLYGGLALCSRLQSIRRTGFGSVVDCIL